MPQVAWDEPRIDAGFKEMGGVRMSAGMDGDPCFGNAGPVFGGPEGALATGATQGKGSRRALFGIAPCGGKEPGRVTGGFPVDAEQSERIFGEGDVAVFGALAAVDMDLEARAIDVRDLQGEGFMEPEAQAGAGGAGDLVVQGGSGRKEPPDLRHTEDGGEPGCSWRA